jgi:hypothetical protein
VSEHLRQGLLTVSTRGPHVYGVQRVDEALLLAHCCAKNQQKWIRGKNIVTPKIKRIVFIKNY